MLLDVNSVIGCENMKIKSIGLLNFKAFTSTPEGDDLEIFLGGKSTVFYGVNGAGKSTLLSAASYALWPFINKLNISQGKDYQTMSSDLLHKGKRHKKSGSNCSVFLSLIDGDNEFCLEKGIQVKSNRTAIPLYRNSPYLKQLVDYFISNYLSDEEFPDDGACIQNMPVFLNYGTNRSVLDVPLRIRNNHSLTKRAALERALESSLDFRTFFMWYRNQEDIENEQKSIDHQDKLLQCVRTAIKNMMDDIEEIKVCRTPLRMVVVKHGIEVNIEQLSDGEKCTLALLGDIARRVAMANPCHDNPLEGDGVVMIDEIDLHLHPAWQRKILNVLKKTFPNIQFIITTHSPQVLGEVDDSYNLFSIITDQHGNRNIEQISRLDCFDSNYILENFMQTSPDNISFQERITAIYRSIRETQFEVAHTQIVTLTDLLGPNHPEILALEGEYRRSRYKYEKNLKG